MRNKTPPFRKIKDPQCLITIHLPCVFAWNIGILLISLLAPLPAMAAKDHSNRLTPLQQKAMFASKNENFAKVITLLLTDAKKGEYVSMFLVGDAYRELYLSKPELKYYLARAIYWLKKTAKINAREAGFLLASISYKKEYGKRDYRQAHYWLHRAADRGSAGALNTLGIFYKNGQGVKIDLKKAEKFYKAALANDYQGAIINLAGLYQKSPRSQHNYQQSIYYYKKAIRLKIEGENITVNNSIHDFALLHYRYKKFRLACDTWKPLADAGHQGSQYNLARCYEYGIGYKKDLQKGLYYYELAYKNGRNSVKKHIDYLKNRIEIIETATLATNYFRRIVKVGSRSHCGLVIEVKPPIAKIQTRIGERWLRIDQLHPVVLNRLKPCRFVRGQYSEPN